METRRAYWKERFKSSFWATPTLTALAVLALLPLALWAESLPSVRALSFESDTVQSSRLVLSSIATAVMTVVGVLLSVTIVVLQQVSQQYAPRVIENFIRSTSNQVVFGFYLGTFAYSLLLLRSIPESGGSKPSQLALVGAIVLAIVCLALLIYYVHHLAKSIKSNTILAGIAQQAVETIRDLVRDVAHEDHAKAFDQHQLPHELVLTSEKNGYLQQIDWRQLEDVLTGMAWVGRLCVVPGDYIHYAYPLIELKTAAPLAETQRTKVAALFKIDLNRTHSQDIRFGIRQMVDVALRALSPGINDPSTAIEALNEITTVLLYYTRHGVRSAQVRFSDGACLWLKEPSYRELVDLCVNEIAVAGEKFYLVQDRIDRMLEHCQKVAKDPAQIGILQNKLQQLKAERGVIPGSKLYA